MGKYGMKCCKCKKNKELNYFSDDYDIDKPICNLCLGFKEIQEPTLIFNRKELNKIKKEKKVYIKKIKLENKQENKIRKNKKRYYNSEFRLKSKLLLSNARLKTGCSDCNSKDFLQVHHIDKNIYNNSNENLKVVCFYCHSKFHKHMQWQKPPIWLK